MGVSLWYRELSLAGFISLPVLGAGSSCFLVVGVICNGQSEVGILPLYPFILPVASLYLRLIFFFSPLLPGRLFVAVVAM